MRRVLAVTIAVFLLGCGKTDPGKAQLQKEIEQLRQARGEAEAEKLALREEIAAYRADLEHQRFLNQEMKRKLKDLKDLQQIVEIAKGLPKNEPVSEKPAPPKPPAEKPQPAPGSAAIAVARTLPDAQPPRPAPLASPVAPEPAGPMEDAPSPARKPKPDPKPKATPDTAAAAKPAQPPAPANTEAVSRKKTPPAPAATIAERKPASKPEPEPVAKPRVEEAPTATKEGDPAPATASATKSEAAEAPKAVETPPPHVSAVGAEELQLLNLVNRREGDGLLLSGQVRNNTSLPAQNVVVTCKLYDKQSQAVREMRISVGGGAPVPAGASVEFRAETPWDARISGCRFEVEGVQRVDVSRNN
ncbi:MAG: FxLYD domain-containing protein [Planctomycetota bacterium]